MKYELPSIELIVIEENNYLKFGEYLNDMQCDDTTNKLSFDDLEYVKKLQQQNKQLQERIEYLERSIVRKEKTITELEQEQVPYTNEYADKVDKENKKLNGAIQTYDILLKANVEENKQLKQKYENAVADYETTMFEKEQLNSLVNSCQEEIRQLKKQLEDYKKLGFKHLQDKNNNLETQQKEFIKYLEDESKEIYRDGGLRQYIFRQILRKYRSITGVSDENNIK
jgi:chromosome segregation ATPase